MATVKELLAMTDEQLMERAAAATPGSAGHDIAVSVLSMRVSIKNLEAARELGKYTQELGKYTLRIAWATWGVAAITFVTQIALLLRK